MQVIVLASQRNGPGTVQAFLISANASSKPHGGVERAAEATRWAAKQRITGQPRLSPVQGSYMADRC